jgi:hypothetical protein
MTENNHRKEKEKIYVSTGEWRMITSAINHGTAVPADSRREVLMGYQYALHQHKKKLLQEKSELRKSHESNNASSRPQWEEYSGTSESSEERHCEPKHSRGRIDRPVKESRARNHNSSSLTVYKEENIIQDRPEAALVAAQVYMLTTQPETGDPRESMHLAAIKSLVIEAEILGKGSSTA